MTTRTLPRERSIGLFGATGIGVGAIVGGGILALAGTALAATGPSAVVAFALNGVIALVTALSFAELATAFPQSGGTYTFAKRVLGVGAAFNVGWVVWFASIVAAALYAAGLAAFVLGSVAALAPAGAGPWLASRPVLTATAILATAGCAAVLSRSAGPGGNAVNVLKVLVFVVLIGGGLWAWLREAPPAVERLRPFLPRGLGGLAQAMGFTFIALQGFDLVAAVAGEVREPRRVLPRAMLLSLGIALAVYLPLMVLIPVVGVGPEGTLGDLLAAGEGTVIAVAARNFLGPAGFWLVMAAGILAMLSALLANLYAAARIGQVMARDRTLPARLERDSARGVPLRSLWLTAGISTLILLAVGDVGEAGAAASLIFLITFAMAQGICVLARRRRPDHGGFRVPLWPWLPLAGGACCAALAVFQGIAVPAAGAIAGAWLVAGSFCYMWLFGRRARVIDAASEAADPYLLELRGRSPLVLVPIANPANALTLATLASCLCPARVGRVLLLNVVHPDRAADGVPDLGAVLEPSLAACLKEQVRVEALATVSADPWVEIERVARVHRCASVLMGMHRLDSLVLEGRIERLARRLQASTVVLEAPPGWRPEGVRRILIPVGGGGENNALRARLLAMLLLRTEATPEVCYLQVLPAATTPDQVAQAERRLGRFVADETPLSCEIRVAATDDAAAAVLAAATAADLVVMGLNQADPTRPVYGALVTAVLTARPCPVMVIGHRS